MAVTPPLLDKRDIEDIMKELRNNAGHYLREWRPGNETDPGVMLQHIFGRLMEMVVERLNRVPEKQLLAFLDAMGVSILPPFPASAPLVFSLKKDASPAFVPRGAALTAKAPDSGPPVVFETTEDLTVLPASITCAYTMEPGRGRFGEYTGFIGGAGGFTPFTGDRAIQEAFYFFDNAVMPFDPSVVGISVEITTEKFITGRQVTDFAENVSWFYVDCDGVRPFQPGLYYEKYGYLDNDRYNIINFALPDLQGIEPQTAPPGMPREGCRPTAGSYFVLVTNDDLGAGAAVADVINLSVFSIKVTEQFKMPEYLVFDNARLNPHSNFMPFGKRPKAGDSFYIYMGDLLSRPGASVMVDLTASKTTVGVDGSWDKLEYYYYSTGGWRSIPLEDDDSILSYSFRLNFICSPDVAPCKIGSVNGFWIRVKLPPTIDYGSEPKYTPSGGVDPKTGYDYPEVRDIKIGSEYHAVCETYRQTGHIYRPHCKPSEDDISKGIASCSIPSPEGFPELAGTHFYLGFDNFLEHRTVSLYADAEPSPDDSEAVKGADDRHWEYRSTNGWQPLYTKDDSDRLTKSGMIRFATPADASREQLFDNTARYWVRVAPWRRVRLRGLYMNAVIAKQATAVSRETLGSSNGQSDQRFSIVGTPVLPGQRLWVREIELPTAPELSETRVDIRQNTLTLEPENWVLWQEQNSFGASQPNSRHYTLDRERGEIRFGDGIRGMRPERGAAISAQYRYGGGIRGNLPAGAIAKLKAAIPGIERVSNPIPSCGGADSEDIPGILDRGPMSIRHRGRGVSARDIEWLAKDAAGAAVNRIKYLPGEGDRTFTLLLVPAEEGLRPLPDGALAARVRDYIAGRIPAGLSGDRSFAIVGPRYITVGLTVEVVPENLLESSIVRERATTRLAGFLHPLTGGPKGAGWDFGRDVYLSEICEQLESVPGVERARAGTVSIHPYAAQREITIEHSMVRLEAVYPAGSLLSVYSAQGAVCERWRTAEAIYGDSLPEKLRLTGLREGDKLNILNVFRYQIDDTEAKAGTLIDFPKGSVVNFASGFTTTLSSGLRAGNKLESEVFSGYRKHLTANTAALSTPNYVDTPGEVPPVLDDIMEYTLTHPDRLEVVGLDEIGDGGYSVTVRYMPAGFVLAPGAVVECRQSKVRALVNEVEFKEDNTAVLCFTECCDFWRNHIPFSLAQPDGTKSVSLTAEAVRPVTDIAYLFDNELCTPGDIDVTIGK